MSGGVRVWLASECVGVIGVGLQKARFICINEGVGIRLGGQGGGVGLHGAIVFRGGRGGRSPCRPFRGQGSNETRRG